MSMSPAWIAEKTSSAIPEAQVQREGEGERESNLIRQILKLVFIGSFPHPVPPC